MTHSQEQLRRAALDSVDTAEKRVKQALVAAAVLEASLLATFFFLMDTGNRLHWLILVAALLVYATLSVGLLTLGTHVQACTLRVLKAIDLEQAEKN